MNVRNSYTPLITDVNIFCQLGVSLGILCIWKVYILVLILAVMSLSFNTILQLTTVVCIRINYINAKCIIPSVNNYINAGHVFCDAIFQRRIQKLG